MPPRLGPWISISRERLPRAPLGGAGVGSSGPSSGSVPPASGPGSSSTQARPSSSSPPGSPPDSAGWQKPPKVARRGAGYVARQGFRDPAPSGGSVFAPLAGLGDRMDHSPVCVPAVDVVLPDASVPVLKRPRSPGEGVRKAAESSGVKTLLLLPPPAPESGGASSTGSSSWGSSIAGQVSCPDPCMIPGSQGVLGKQCGGRAFEGNVDFVPVVVDSVPFPSDGGGEGGVCSGGGLAPVLPCSAGSLQGRKGVVGGSVAASSSGKGKEVLVDVEVLMGRVLEGGLDALAASDCSLSGEAGVGSAGRRDRGRRGRRGGRGGGSAAGARSRGASVGEGGSVGAVVRARSRSPPLAVVSRGGGVAVRDDHALVVDVVQSVLVGRGEAELDASVGAREGPAEAI